MLFNSFEFLIFFGSFYLIYWLILGKNLRLQNLFILLSSYFFYGWWEWKFLLLIIATSFTSFYAAKKIEDEPSRKKIYLWAVLAINFGMLIYFKYAGFITSMVGSLLNALNLSENKYSLQIVLPVGISFFTFQAMSYVIDVYRGELSASRNFVECASFISFFPQLVAGPIERATNLLPQVQKPKVFNEEQSREGLRYILWGLFKKMMIADNCAPIVNDIFSKHTEYSSPMLWYGAILFAFQIYCDFSGYSEIAIGCGKLLGISFMRNFSYPYFTTNIQSFWQAWHISLTTWFKDYVYIPLGGSKVGKWVNYRNILIVFLLSGIWHGANYTFIAWGLYHALLYVIYLLFIKNSKIKIPYLIGVIITFIFVVVGWVLFRASNLESAWEYMTDMFTNFSDLSVSLDIKSSMGIFILLLVEYFNKEKSFGLELNKFKESYLRWSIYLALILILLAYGSFSEQSFIYFNF